MSAKEMFEELGFKQFESFSILEYQLNETLIRFWKKSKHIELFDSATPDFIIEDEKYFDYDYKLFVAINKQIEELGWNEK